MSKAFTKEDDDAGFTAPAPSSSGIPIGPFRLTQTGARKITDARALANAEVLPRVSSPDRAALGVTVVVEADGKARRRYRLVSAEERALIGEGCSIDGPIGRALLGAKVGDVREVALPRGSEELEVVALEGEQEPAEGESP